MNLIRQILTFCLFTLCTSSVVICQRGHARKTTVQVSGVGSTPSAAIDEGLKNALLTAFGGFLRSETTLENDDITFDRLLSLTQGSIAGYEILDEAIIKDAVHVHLRVEVSTNLANEFISETHRLVKSAEKTLDYQSFENHVKTYVENINRAEVNAENERELLDALFVDAELRMGDLFNSNIQRVRIEMERGSAEARITAKTVPTENVYSPAAFLVSALGEVALSRQDAASRRKLGYPVYKASIAVGQRQYDFLFRTSAIYSHIKALKSSLFEGVDEAQKYFSIASGHRGSREIKKWHDARSPITDYGIINQVGNRSSSRLFFPTKAHHGVIAFDRQTFNLDNVAGDVTFGTDVVLSEDERLQQVSRSNKRSLRRANGHFSSSGVFRIGMSFYNMRFADLPIFVRVRSFVNNGYQSVSLYSNSDLYGDYYSNLDSYIYLLNGTTGYLAAPCLEWRRNRLAVGLDATIWRKGLFGPASVFTEWESTYSNVVFGGGITRASASFCLTRRQSLLALKVGGNLTLLSVKSLSDTRGYGGELYPGTQRWLSAVPRVSVSRNFLNGMFIDCHLYPLASANFSHAGMEWAMGYRHVLKR